MDSVRIINCQDLSFSAKLSRDRIDRALGTFGADVIKRLLCFALYLLGLNRRIIAKLLGLPTETVKSFIKTITRDGLGALEDRRRKTSTFIPNTHPKLQSIALNQHGQFLIIDFGGQDRQLKLNQHDPLQMRTVLLSMMNSNLLTKQQVADIIGLTPTRTAALARQIMQDGTLCLTDKRRGQKQDYRFTPEMKAELIQQFTLDVITGETTSSTSISEQLEQRCQITIPPRTIRHHLGKLGLPKIKHSLLQLVALGKKNSCNGV